MVLLLVLVAGHISAQQSALVKVGFFASGPIFDGAFVQTAYQGLQRIIAKYGTRVKVDFNGPDQVRNLLSLVQTQPNIYIRT